MNSNNTNPSRQLSVTEWNIQDKVLKKKSRPSTFITENKYVLPECKRKGISHLHMKT
jgi:hypothetical protein